MLCSCMYLSEAVQWHKRDSKTEKITGAHAGSGFEAPGYPFPREHREEAEGRWGSGHLGWLLCSGLGRF